MKDRVARAKQLARDRAKEHATRIVPDDETRERLAQGAARVGRAAKDAALDDVKDDDGKIKKGKVLRRAVVPTKSVKHAAESAKQAATNEVQQMAREGFFSQDDPGDEDADSGDESLRPPN